jgi:hypothetical protein
MKKLLILYLLFAALIFHACHDSSVSPPESVSYKEIVSANIPGSVNIKLYITDGDSLTTGYNDIFMKVWKNSDEQSSGFVKFFPKMWMTPTYMHSTAVSEKFYYDNSIGYYKGYAIFSMVTSPPEVVWYGVFTYVDGQGIIYQQQDSTPMYTAYHMEKQWRFFFDTNDQSIYMFSLVKPFEAKTGTNDLCLLLHKTEAHLLNHEELHDAVMSISVYDIHNFNQSTGNVSPVHGSDGYYRGKFNVPYPGEWKVCDTIWYQGRLITNNPPPMPEFYYNIP